MANPEHVKIVKQGAEAIAAWREENPDKRLELSEAELSSADLRFANLDNADLLFANLRGSDLRTANLHIADLGYADLTGANLDDANLDYAELGHSKLRCTNLNSAVISFADFTDADLSYANLRDSLLHGAKLISANLLATDLVGARLSDTTIVRTILVEANGLENVVHDGPSSIGVDTLVNSQGKIPDVFLQGCGFKPWQILDAKLYDPNLSAAEISDLQYRIFDARTSGPLILGGVFISYAHDDAGFADKIRKKLMEKGVSVWLDRHDLVAGPLQKQIDRAVGLNNVVLLVLSKTSIESDWVEHEVKTARKIERETKRDVLCPVALDDEWKKEKVDDVNWEHLTNKHILDFSKWKTKAFAAQFDKLLKGLKIYYEKPDNKE